MLPIPVLLYHAVDTVAPTGQERYTVDPAQFREHLAVVADNATVVPLGDIVASLTSGAPLPDSAVALTFDDGFRCMIRTIAPMLHRRGMPATLFQTTGFIGGRFCASPVLSERELCELDDAGIDIGSHTVTHPHLDIISRRRLRAELADSRDRLEQVLGRPVAGLAYPHGSHRAVVKDQAAGAGYRWAVAVKDAYTHRQDDPWAVARVTITRDWTPEKVAQTLGGGAAPMSWSGERLRTTAFRQIRRLRRPRGYDPDVG